MLRRLKSSVNLNLNLSFQGIIVLFLKVYIFFEAFSALILYLLGLGGISSLFYLRELLIIFPITVSLLFVFYRKKISRGDLILFFILIISSVWGYINTGNLLLVLFGAKLTLPFIVGYILSKFWNIQEIQIQLTNFFIFIFWITICGVALNYFFLFPWEGSSIEVGGVEVETSRSWNAYGTQFRRLAGFTRGSSGAATLISISALFAIVNAKVKLEKFLFIILSIVGISLTTMKGLLLSFIITVVILHWNLLYTKRKVVPLFLFSLSIFLPVLSNILLEIFLTKNKALYIFLYSFLDRMFRVWPETILLIKEQGNVLLGRGLGGVGLAQTYFEFDSYQPADNASLFLWGNFGLVGLLLPFLFVFKLARTRTKDAVPLLSYLILILFFANGIIAAVPSNGIYTVLVGAIFGHVISKR